MHFIVSLIGILTIFVYPFIMQNLVGQYWPAACLTAILYASICS